MPVLIHKAISEDFVANESGMYIDHWLTAPTIDNAGDAIDASVINFDLLHRENPVHLFAHDRTNPLAAIGKYEDPDGNYTIKALPFPGGEGLGSYGRVYYSQVNPWGAITFGLYREGILRGFSIGMFGGARKVERNAAGRSYSRITKAVCYEGSSLACPANNDARADRLPSVLSKGMLNGYKIPDRMAVILKGLVPPRPVSVRVPINILLKTRLSLHASEGESAMENEKLEVMHKAFAEHFTSKPPVAGFLLLPEGAEVKIGEQLFPIGKGMDEMSPGDGLKAECMALCNSMFTSGDVKGCMRKMKALLKTHKMLTDADKIDEDEPVSKELSGLLAEIGDRVDQATEFIEENKGLGERIVALEAKLAAAEKKINEQSADIGTLDENVKAVAAAAKVIRK